DQSKLQSIQDVQGFSLPVLKDPASLFKVLLGQDVTLVTYVLPRLDFNFDYSQFFPIIGPLGVTLEGQIGATADLAFGLDTKGLRQFKDSGYSDPALLLNGFYVSDTDHADGTGKDIPELQIYGGINVYAAVDLGIAEFGAGGGIKATVNID